MKSEIEQTLAEYRRTQFGGWPWLQGDSQSAPDHARTHGRNPKRFAVHPDGRREIPQ